MTKKESDWLSEVWRIKRELSQEAMKMGLKKYLDFAENEAERIYCISEKRKKHTRVRDKKSKNFGEK